MHASLLIQWDVEAESAGLQGYTQLHSENEASLSYMKPNLKQNWTKQNQQIAVSLNDKKSIFRHTSSYRIAPYNYF